MKKSLRENPDAGLVVLVLFFLIIIIAGMWFYQAKSLQKHLPQNKPAAEARQSGIPSLVLHGDLSQLNGVASQNDNSKQPESGAAAAPAAQTSRQSASSSPYVHKASPVSAPGINQSSALPELKVNVQPACGAAGCINEPLSSVESLVK